MAEPVCCLCGKKPKTLDWCEWQRRPGGRYLRCHETCVLALVEKAARERESGQKELFVDYPEQS